MDFTESDWIFKAAVMDVRYWRLLHADYCPNCKVSWDDIPAEANAIPHWHGDCKKAAELAHQKQDELFLKSIGIRV